MDLPDAIALTVIVLTTLWIVLLRLVARIAERRSNPLDYSDDEIANAGDVWLASVADGCDISAPSARGEGTRGGVSRAGRDGLVTSFHKSGDSACPRQ